MRGGGFGLIGNLVVGILGAIIGRWLLNLLDLSIGNSFVPQLFTSVIGATVLLFLVSLIKGRR